MVLLWEKCPAEFTGLSTIVSVGRDLFSSIDFLIVWNAECVVSERLID